MILFTPFIYLGDGIVESKKTRDGLYNEASSPTVNQEELSMHSQ
jgi:hypothetical protein